MKPVGMVMVEVPTHEDEKVRMGGKSWFMLAKREM